MTLTKMTKEVPVARAFVHNRHPSEDAHLTKRREYKDKTRERVYMFSRIECCYSNVAPSAAGWAFQLYFLSFCWNNLWMLVFIDKLEAILATTISKKESSTWDNSTTLPSRTFKVRLILWKPMLCDLQMLHGLPVRPAASKRLGIRMALPESQGNLWPQVL